MYKEADETAVPNMPSIFHECGGKQTSSEREACARFVNVIDCNTSRPCHGTSSRQRVRFIQRSSLASQTLELCVNRCWPRRQAANNPPNCTHTYTWRMACLQTHYVYKSAPVPRAFWELGEGVYEWERVCVWLGLGVQNLDTKRVPAAGDGSAAEVRRCCRGKWKNMRIDLVLVLGFRS